MFLHNHLIFDHMLYLHKYVDLIIKLMFCFMLNYYGKNEEID